MRKTGRKEFSTDRDDAAFNDLELIARGQYLRALVVAEQRTIRRAIVKVCKAAGVTVKP